MGFITLEKDEEVVKDGKTLGSITLKKDAGGRVLTVSSSIEEIPESAFVNRKLTEVIIPRNVRAIGHNAFKGNPDLKLVKIEPKLLANTNADDFPPGTEFPDWIGGITRITTDKDGKITRSLEFPSSVTEIPDTGTARGMYQSITLKRLLFAADSKLTYIGKSAFRSNELESVEIPNQVTHIGNHAFYANSLTEIKIPNSVIYIGGHAFTGNQLKSVTIGRSVKTIGSGAFEENLLESVTIPTTVRSIGDHAFAGNPGFTSVTISQELLDSIPADAFPDTGVTFTDIDEGGTITRTS